MSKTADVVVIGGGTQGVCSAYYLAQKGLKVIVVEQGDLASGTGSRSDGDAFNTDFPPGHLNDLAEATLKLLSQLAHDLDCDFDWMQRGFVFLIQNEQELEYAKQFYQMKKDSGVAVRFMDQKEVHYDEPKTASDIIAGLEFSAGGSLNPMLFMYGLGEAVKKMGGELFRFTTVNGFGLDQDGAIEKVVTSNGDIFTKNVVLAAGIWSKSLASLIGIDLPIYNMKGDLLVTEHNTKITRRKTVEFGYNLISHGDGSYKRNTTQFMDDHGIGFLTEPTMHNALIGFSKYPGNSNASDSLITRAIAKRAMQFFPCIKDMNIIRTYSGLRPCTADHTPIISATDIPGFYVTSGHSGNGIMFGPISGKLISQMICEEEPECDLSCFSLSRFQ